MNYLKLRERERRDLDRLAENLGDVPHWTVGAHAFLDQAIAVAELPGGRLPVLRRGTRAEIPAMTRRLVLRRDNHHCRRCEWPDQLQLDHVVPWSHNGPDRSDNLQTLCDQCNNARSNFGEIGMPQRIVGVTVICDPCADNHDGNVFDLHYRSGLWFGCPICRFGDGWRGDERIPAYCGTCDYTSWVSDRSRIQ